MLLHNSTFNVHVNETNLHRNVRHFSNIVHDASMTSVIIITSKAQLSLWNSAAVISNRCSRSANGIYNIILDFIPKLNINYTRHTRCRWTHYMHFRHERLIFSVRQHICYSAICHRPSVRLSVRPSHGWISQRRLKLGSRNLHHRVAPWL